MVPPPIIKSNIIDQVDTQPVAVEELPTPEAEPIPNRPESFDDSDTRRLKYQGKDVMETEIPTPSTTVPSASEPEGEKHLLEQVEAELKESQVLRPPKYCCPRKDLKQYMLTTIVFPWPSTWLFAMFFFHSCQVPTRRDQLSTKNANSEGRRGRGRGGRGRGRGGRAQVKTIEEKESDQYGYDDSEMWAEFWKWQYGWEESHAADHTLGGDKVEKVSKKRKAETKEKTEDTTKPKSVKTDPEHCKKRKETNEMAPAKASKALKRAVVEFAKRFDYHNLDLDNMKVRIKEELPVLKNISFNCYWTRAACGVRQKQDGPGSKFKEVPSAYFRFPTCHASHNLQLAVAVGASIQLVSYLLFWQFCLSAPARRKKPNFLVEPPFQKKTNNSFDQLLIPG